MGRKNACTGCCEEFQENQLVWARLSGFPWWPAIIFFKETKGRDLKYLVRFIGEDSEAFLKQNDIQIFDGFNDPNLNSSKTKELKYAVDYALCILNGKLEWEELNDEEIMQRKPIVNMIVKENRLKIKKSNKIYDSDSLSQKNSEVKIDKSFLHRKRKKDDKIKFDKNLKKEECKKFRPKLIENKLDQPAEVSEGFEDESPENENLIDEASEGLQDQSLSNKDELVESSEEKLDESAEVNEERRDESVEASEEKPEELSEASEDISDQFTEENDENNQGIDKKLSKEKTSIANKKRNSDTHNKLLTNENFDVENQIDKCHTTNVNESIMNANDINSEKIFNDTKEIISNMDLFVNLTKKEVGNILNSFNTIYDSMNKLLETLKFNHKNSKTMEQLTSTSRLLEAIKPIFQLTINKEKTCEFLFSIQNWIGYEENLELDRLQLEKAINLMLNRVSTLQENIKLETRRKEIISFFKPLYLFFKVLMKETFNISIETSDDLKINNEEDFYEKIIVGNYIHNTNSKLQTMFAKKFEKREKRIRVRAELEKILSRSLTSLKENVSKHFFKNFSIFLELKSVEKDQKLGKVYEGIITSILKRIKNTFVISSELFYDFYY